MSQLDYEEGRFRKLISESLFTALFPESEGKGYVWLLKGENLSQNVRWKIGEYLAIRSRMDMVKIEQYIFESYDVELQNLLNDYLMKRRVSTMNRRVLSVSCVIGLAGYLIERGEGIGKYIQKKVMKDHQDSIEHLARGVNRQSYSHYYLVHEGVINRVEYENMSIYKDYASDDELEEEDDDLLNDAIDDMFVMDY